MNDVFNILSKDFLTSISLESSLGINLANYSMSKFNDDNLQLLLSDIEKMQDFECGIIQRLGNSGVGYRIKSIDSILLKINKYKVNVRKAILCFNDLIGFRVVYDTLPSVTSIPDYFQVIDLSNGKVNDDGYKALHLYFKLSNRHYPIEIQIWEKADENFINWSHKYCYKVTDSNIIKKLREKYDNKEIQSEDDFKREFDILVACSLFRV